MTRADSNHYVIAPNSGSASIFARKAEGHVELLLITRPLPRDGGMAEDHGAPETAKLPRVWTRGRRETESRLRVSGAKSSYLDSAE